MANLYSEINNLLETLLKKLVAADKSGFKLNGKNDKYTLSEILVLMELLEGEISMLDLIKSVEMDRGLISTSLTRLTNAGWMTKNRSEKDRRVFLLKLTDEGHGVATKVKAQFKDTIGLVLKDMTINEQKAVLKFLSKLNQTTVDKYDPNSAE